MHLQAGRGCRVGWEVWQGCKEGLLYIKGSRDAMNKFTYQMKVATSSHKCAASKSVGRDQKRHRSLMTIKWTTSTQEYVHSTS
jgi:hypothetical protein